MLYIFSHLKYCIAFYAGISQSPLSQPPVGAECCPLNINRHNKEKHITPVLANLPISFCMDLKNGYFTALNSHVPNYTKHLLLFLLELGLFIIPYASTK